MNHSNTNVQTRNYVKKILLTIIMFIFGISMIIPFVWMLSASLKKEIDVFKYPIEWVPKTFEWTNYAEVWGQRYSFYVFYINSIKVTVIQEIGLLITSSLAAYGFAKLKFKGRDAIFLLYLSTMMIPDQVVMVPRFIMFKNMGILDTHWSLILPGIFAVFGVFMLRQFFITIPDELSEAAIIDGCNHFEIWYKIILPLAKPAIASLLILTFVWKWNDYEQALIFLSTRSKLTIPIGLNLFLDENDQRYALIMAATCSATLPVLLVFIAGQKYFVEGIATSGIKG